MCEHRFCSQTKTIGDRNCTACFSLANIFNQSTNKSFGAKLQSEVTGGFTQVRIGNLINQSSTSCAISIPPLLEDCSEQKTFKDVFVWGVFVLEPGFLLCGFLMRPSHSISKWQMLTPTREHHVTTIEWQGNIVS